MATVAAEACVRALLTPGHPLHTMMVHTPQPLQCLQWSASVSDAMRAVRREALCGWPHEVTVEPRILHRHDTEGRLQHRLAREGTEPFASQTAFLALQHHCGFQQAGQRANVGVKADGLLGPPRKLHGIECGPPLGHIFCERVGDYIPFKINPPHEAALQAIGALQAQGLKPLLAELKKVHSLVDGLAGLVEHLLMLHDSKFFDMDRFRKAVFGKSGDCTPPSPMVLVSLPGPFAARSS